MPLLGRRDRGEKERGESGEKRRKGGVEVPTVGPTVGKPLETELLERVRRVENRVNEVAERVGRLANMVYDALNALAFVREKLDTLSDAKTSPVYSFSVDRFSSLREVVEAYGLQGVLIFDDEGLEVESFPSGWEGVPPGLLLSLVTGFEELTGELRIAVVMGRKTVGVVRIPHDDRIFYAAFIPRQDLPMEVIPFLAESFSQYVRRLVPRR